MNQFAVNLRRIRHERGLTQVELSNKIGNSHAVVAQYENGHRDPGIENLTKLAEALGVSLSVLAGTDDSGPLCGPRAVRLASAFNSLSERDQEIVVRLAETLSGLLGGT